MSNGNIPKELLLEQLEDALEERQRPDRRQQDAGLPADVRAERRRGDRRQRHQQDDESATQS